MKKRQLTIKEFLVRFYFQLGRGEHEGLLEAGRRVDDGVFLRVARASSHSLQNNPMVAFICCCCLNLGLVCENPTLVVLIIHISHHKKSPRIQ